MLQQYLTGQGPITALAENLLQETMTGTGGQALNAPAIQQYLQDVIYGPARKTLQEQVMPEIAAQYGKGGAYFSTPRAAAETKAGTDLESQLQTIASNLTWQQMQQQKANQMTALTQGLQYPAGKIQMGMQYGGKEREIATGQQNTILNNIQQYLQQKQYEAAVIPGQAGMGSSLMGSLGQGMGSSCCFIFIKGEKLTKQVRNFRDTFFNEDSFVAQGYRKMAKWLVPAMNNKFIKRFVKFIMVDPMAKFAEYYYKNDRCGYLYAPISLFWAFTWGHLGRLNDLLNNSN